MDHWTSVMLHIKKLEKFLAISIDKMKVVTLNMPVSVSPYVTKALPNKHLICVLPTKCSHSRKNEYLLCGFYKDDGGSIQQKTQTLKSAEV